MRYWDLVAGSNIPSCRLLLTGSGPSQMEKYVAANSAPGTNPSTLPSSAISTPLPGSKENICLLLYWEGLPALLPIGEERNLVPLQLQMLLHEDMYR